VRKRRIYLALVGLGIVIGGIVVLSRPEREPEDGGVPLSRLVERLGSGRYIWDDTKFQLGLHSQMASVSRIGTNAIPYLLKSIRYEQPAWKRSLFAGINIVLGKVRTGWGIADHRKLRADGSSAALCVLGPTASGAVPDLARIANDPNAPESAGRAAIVLESLKFKSTALEPVLVP